MKLLEILDTVPSDVHWSSVANQHRGEFSIDGAKVVVEIDEYDALGLHLIDLGFSVDGSIDIKGGAAPSARTLGSVVNVARQKIVELNPDAILLSVKNWSGAAESRLKLYQAMSARLVRQRLLPHSFSTGWVKNSDGAYCIMSTKSLTDEQAETFFKKVAE